MERSIALAIAIAPFRLIQKVLSVVVKNKILLIVLIAVIGFLVIKGQFSKNDTPGYPLDAAQQAIQSKIPSKSIAPRLVQTTSRYYPYATFRDTPDYKILTDYYVYDNDKWQHITQELPISKSAIVNDYTR